MKSIKRLLALSGKDNIAKDLDKQRLSDIGSLCKSSYESDLETSSDHFAKIDENIEMAKQVIEEKSDPWPGAANAKYPLLTVAAMQFNARAMPALLPAGKIVKARHFGEDPGGAKSDRCERVSAHMSYQLYYDMDDWVEGMDQLLLLLPTVGGLYKKTYRNSLKQKSTSVLVQPKKLVVDNDNTKTIESAPRVTEILERTPSEIKANINANLWIDHDIKYEDEEKEVPEEILEQHVLLDLFGDGNKEPYIVTMHADTGNIFRIKACYDEDTILIDLDGEYRPLGESMREIEAANIEIRKKNMMAQQLAEQNQENAVTVPEKKALNPEDYSVVCVEKLQYYTEYAYLPSFDGKFYKAGLGDLIASISGLIDTNLNQMLDAGTLANLQGGVKVKESKISSGVIDAVPGEYSDIDTGGLPIRDAIMPFSFPGPSGVLFNLLGMLIEAARDITSIKDIMVGEAPQGETATTTMIKREEGMKVFSAIYKRVYRSMSKEFQKLFALNKKYLKQEEYFRFGDAESYISQEDYEDDGLNIIPVADPNESTMADRMLKAEALMSLMDAPDADRAEIQKNYVLSMGIDESEYERFFPGQEPTEPGPEENKIVAETEEIKVRTRKTAVEIQLTHAKALEAIANAESKEIGTQLDIYKQALEEIGGQLEANTTGSEGMAGAPGDAMGAEGGIPGMAEGGAEPIMAAPKGGEIAGNDSAAGEGMPGLQ